jgi:DNA-directed RNA polymerase specialized sigma24 family protein
MAEQEAGGRSALVAPAMSAEAEALGHLGDSDAVRALTELPAAYKAVVYLADVEGYRCAEIADFLGIPVGTVMSRIHRGRTMLRAKLSQPRPRSAPRAARRPVPAPAMEIAGLAA